VLFFGRVVLEKGLALLADAFDRLSAARPHARALIVGDGPARPWLEQRLPSACFTGFLKGQELAAAVASADVLLNPSVTETFGNVTLEAMASGLAVVAYRTAAARQHIEDGVSGLLAEPGDRAGFIAHAVSLAREPQLARELGRAARAAAAPISWERITVDFEAVLQETALEHAARREAAHATA